MTSSRKNLHDERPTTAEDQDAIEVTGIVEPTMPKKAEDDVVIDLIVDDKTQTEKPELESNKSSKSLYSEKSAKSFASENRNKRTNLPPVVKGAEDKETAP